MSFSLRGALVPLFFCMLQSVSGNYVITWPKAWFSGTPLQFCIALDRNAESGDAVTVQILVPDNDYDYPEFPKFNYSGGTVYLPYEVPQRLDLYPDTEIVVLEERLTPEIGSKHSCVSVFPPLNRSYYAVRVRVRGTLSGASFDETREISTSSVESTFIQTDKRKYKPGQKVQFRLLTLSTPDMIVQTEPYDLIYIQDPTRTRIQQWIDVPNPSGLVHLEFQLDDEPREGTYTIYARNTRQTFIVEEYVLPRFEVTIDAPGFVLASDETLEFEVCAQYTFGEPVRGMVGVNVNNARYGKSEREENYLSEIVGCETVRIPLAALRINRYNDFVYTLRVTVVVVEDGTEVDVEEKFSLRVSRTALSFQSGPEGKSSPKPELPYFTSYRVISNDGQPAPNEPMTVCTRRWVLPPRVESERSGMGCITAPPSGEQESPMTLCPEADCKYLGTDRNGVPKAACLLVLCRNMTTDDSGVLRVTVPPHVFNQDFTEALVEVRALNYPDLFINGIDKPYMRQPKTQIYLGMAPYFSPSNSSLLIKPDSVVVDCTSGSDIQLQLPVLYAASGSPQVTLYVQVVSRGQIKLWTTFTVRLGGSDLDFDDTSLVVQMIAPSSPQTRRGRFTLPLTLPPSVSPKAQVLIWYVRPDGEVVSDVQELRISKCLNYSVELSWPNERVEFGIDLPLNLTSKPGALCSIGIVDKSVELLSGQSSLLNEIFNLPVRNIYGYYGYSSQIDTFTHCLKQSCTGDFLGADRAGKQPSLRMIGSGSSYIYSSRSFTTKHVDAIQTFEDAQLYVISDQTLMTRPCKLGSSGGGGGGAYGLYGTGGGLLSATASASGGAPELGGAGVGPGGAGVGPDLGDTGDSSEDITPAIEVKTRVYFPETWLWELQTIPDSGVYSEIRTLPDTITEWVGKAVCVHPDGVGISAPASITTFTPMFIELTLPPSIKVGEILPLKISVFNYFNTSLSVRINLEESSEYEILDTNSTEAASDQAAAGERAVCVPMQDKETVTIRVRFLVPGSVNITVSAAVEPGLVDNCGSGNPLKGRDRIIAPIAVDYAGFPRERSISLYYCSQDSLPSYPNNISIEAEDIVNNSARAWITVSGELLGPTLANLGYLIRMPYGCGEQNLARFAPNVHIMKYLERSQQQNATVFRKLISHMERGYQQQLNYRRTDGSYSSFGNRDKYGSTWLTAFVLRTYAQAAEYIAVSPLQIQITISWLKSLQLPSGCFQLVGHVHNGRMAGSQGYESAPGTLSAYVMAALLEAGYSNSSEVIVNATACIEAATAPGAIGENDEYLLALKAYAFSLAGHPQTRDVIDDLFTRADSDFAGIYWRISSHYGWYSRALSIEATSYVLLAMLKSNYSDPQRREISLVKWILRDRSGRGGFISTQDTVIALQALTLFGRPVSTKPLNLIIEVSNDVTATFEVTEINKLLEQKVRVESVPAFTQLSFSGEGCALIENVIRYNVEDPEISEVFSLSVSQRPNYNAITCQANFIMICATYLLGIGASNMGIIEVNLVSGYVPYGPDLDRIVSDVTGSIKRYDVDGSQVIFYIDQLSDTEVCVDFTAYESAEVELPSPGTVKVYDYYEPDVFVSKTFTFTRRYCPDE